MQDSPVSDPSRSHDVSGLTTAELERARRELQASLALARPGSAATVPILAQLSAIDTELAGRCAGRGASGNPPSPVPGHRAKHFIRAFRSANPGRPR
jgi:hypothetical protein